MSSYLNPTYSEVNVEEGVYTVNLVNQFGIPPLPQSLPYQNEIYLILKLANREALNEYTQLPHRYTYGLYCDQKRVKLVESCFFGGGKDCHRDLHTDRQIVELFHEFLLQYPAQLQKRGISLESGYILWIDSEHRFTLRGKFVPFYEIPTIPLLEKSNEAPLENRKPFLQITNREAPKDKAMKKNKPGNPFKYLFKKFWK